MELLSIIMAILGIIIFKENIIDIITIIIAHISREVIAHHAIISHHIVLDHTLDQDLMAIFAEDENDVNFY